MPDVGGDYRMTSTFSLYADLKKRIETKEATVATVGLGYVGLPLLLTVNDAGYRALGFDINGARVDAINAGRQVISYFEPDRISNAVATGRVSATSDFARLPEADVILICVPTPLDASREPDLTYVKKAVAGIAEWLRPGQLVVLESTVWPGATATVVKPILEERGLKAGTDFFLGFSPEREDPGNETHNTRTIPKIVGADDNHSRDLLEAFYGRIVTKAVPVSSSATAEAVKLAENSFRTVNIALVNEMKVAMDAMGVDIWEVVRAAATKPFGYMPFWPGPGIGGDCIPVSPVFLSWRARDVGSGTPIIDTARFANDGAPDLIAGRVVSELGKRGTSAEGAKVLVLGISYKKDIEDTRMSPALEIIRRLEAMGASCDYHDPYFPEFPMTRDHPDLAGRTSAALTAESVGGYDAVLVTTDHTDVDYALVADNARLVLDTRNAFEARAIEVPAERFVKA